MKNYKSTVALLFASGILLLGSSCGAGEMEEGEVPGSERSPIIERGDELSPAPVDAGFDNETTAPPRAQAKSEFSFLIGDMTLTLRQRGTEHFSRLPLDRISDTTNRPDYDKRVYPDSYFRTLMYDGLEIVLYAADTGDELWISQMTALKKGIYTSRGIQVGDTLEKLLQKYRQDDISPYTGDGEGNIYRFVSVDPYQVIEFTIASDKVTRIKLIASVE